MTSENVGLVRRAMEAWASRPPDRSTLDSLYHRDHVLTSDWGVEGRTFIGAAGYGEAIAELDDTWQDWSQEIDDVVEGAGERVVALMRLHAVGRESRAPVDWAWALVVTVRDGRIIESQTFIDRERALEAAGVPR